jgi:pimeloyl-ACP methyl ester carboxylesterase
MTSYISVFSSTEGKAKIMRAYDSMLDKWNVPYQELTISTSFGETHVIASGPEGAPPVVLLHALLAGSVSWYRNVEALSQSYSVYAVDVVGEGNKSCALKPITSLDDFLQWFTEVIDSLGIDTMYAIGNSYGGFTAAYHAMKLPERIRKLVLIGPAATIFPMRPFMLHMFIPKAMYIFLPKLPGLESTMRRSVKWMHQDLPIDPLWEPFFYYSLVYGGLINQVFPRVYSKEELSQIKAKTLFILGEQEAIYNDLRSAIKSAQELIPNVEVEIIPAAHHVTALANPEKVNQILLKFFAE